MMYYESNHKINVGLLQAAGIIAVMTLLLIFSSYQILGRFGLFLIAAFAVGSFIALARSRPAFMLKDVTPIRPYQAPELYEMLQRLSGKAGLETLPKLHHLPSPLMNAMTLGKKDDPHIILTQGLLDRLAPDEMEGVLAHEISHVKNDDLSLFGISEVLKRLTSFVARTGWIMLIFFFPFLLFSSSYSFSFPAFLFMIGAPALSLLFQLALMRSREYIADREAAGMIGDPDSLARALRKLSRMHYSFFSLFFPVPMRHDRSLFRTHPDVEERIRRLREMR